MPIDYREKDLPRGGDPTTRYPPAPPPRSDSDKPKEKRRQMSLIVSALMVFDSIVITVMIETSRLDLPFCASGLAALNTAIIALSYKIIRSKNKK